jgi:ribosomal protein S18 acetylase RimI-like enzyme
MPEKEILIKKADPAELDDIFRLYKDHMFDSYLLKFGGVFVKEYLKIILASKNCISFTAKDEEEKIVGFIMSAADRGKVMRELLFNGAFLAAWLKKILSQPSLSAGSAELCRYPFIASAKNIKAEFLFIAVEPAYRKMNLAANLIKETLSLMNGKGIKKVKVSVIAGNRAVNSLLEKSGFRVEKSFRMFKKKMFLYVN